MKRMSTAIIIFILIFCTADSALAADTAGFSIQSTEAAKNRIVTLDFNCDNSSSLAAGIFEFTYDRSALEFKGAECEDGIKVKYKDTNDRLKLVYHNYSENSVSSGVLFKLKFKTLEYGKADISFKAYQCVDFTPNDINVGKCGAGSINISQNAVDIENSSGSGNSSSAKEKSSKNKKSKDENGKNKGSDKDGSDDDDDSDDSDNPDKSAMEYGGELNDVNENSGNNAVLYFILIGVGALILVLTVIQVVKKIRVNKSNKTNKNK